VPACFGGSKGLQSPISHNNGHTPIGWRSGRHDDAFMLVGDDVSDPMEVQRSLMYRPHAKTEQSAASSAETWVRWAPRAALDIMSTVGGLIEDTASASLLDHYNRVASSFALGMLRLSEARIVALTTVIALHKFHVDHKDSKDPGSFSDVPDELRKISFSECDSFHYVSDASYLVYATTLLDTFLSDTTRFLLLLHPGSIGENHAVPLKALLAAESKNDLLNDAATRRSREIGYLPFLARLEFLRNQYGLIKL